MRKEAHVKRPACDTAMAGPPPRKVRTPWRPRLWPRPPWAHDPAPPRAPTPQVYYEDLLLDGDAAAAGLEAFLDAGPRRMERETGQAAGAFVVPTVRAPHRPPQAAATAAAAAEPVPPQFYLILISDLPIPHTDPGRRRCQSTWLGPSRRRTTSARRCPTTRPFAATTPRTRPRRPSWSTPASRRPPRRPGTGAAAAAAT